MSTPSHAVLSVLNPGLAAGPCLVLNTPLNLWGGLDQATGQITDARHPHCGQTIGGRVLVMPPSRGSGTNAQILAQACSSGVGPVGVVLLGPDFVVTVGAIIARRIFDHECPVVVTDPAFALSVRTGDHLAISAGQTPDGHSSLLVTTSILKGHHP